MRQEDFHDMQHLPLFSGVNPDHRDALLKSSYVQRFPAHVTLIREGEPADFLHIIVDGQVDLFSSYQDRETTVSVLGPGDSFIVAAVILDRVNLMSARALSPSRLLLLPAEAVRRVFEADPAFSRIMAAELAKAFRFVVKELKNQKLRSSLERLANWIYAQDVSTGGHGQFELPFDKQILASRLGMAPAVLSRSFAALAPHGVAVKGPIIQIASREALAALARPTRTIDDMSV
jgi:CRP/FNR family transcriptional activator FtrB